VLAQPEAHLHFYGKAEREGRKIGHITVTADDRITLDARIRALAAVLPNPMALPKD